MGLQPTQCWKNSTVHKKCTRSIVANTYIHGTFRAYTLKSSPVSSDNFCFGSIDGYSPRSPEVHILCYQKPGIIKKTERSVALIFFPAEILGQWNYKHFTFQSKGQTSCTMFLQLALLYNCDNKVHLGL